MHFHCRKTAVIIVNQRSSKLHDLFSITKLKDKLDSLSYRQVKNNEKLDASAYKTHK